MAHPNANRTLQALLPDWQRQLQIWATDGRLTAAAQEALLLQEEPRALRHLAKRQVGSIFY